MVEIRAVVQPKVGFASHQNSVPLIADLQVENAGGEPIGPAVLTLTANPGFISPKTWQIDRLAPGSLIRISDRTVDFDGGMLAVLNESLRAQLRFSLATADGEIAVARIDVECLPKLHWGGMSTMGLLAAFCMPNDPAVDRILKMASEVLRKAKKPDEVDGYSRSPKDVWLLVSAIWAAIAKLNLSYALPPASFEAEGQKIRAPGIILDARVATCLDITLLFAACLEQAQLHPVLILTKGHAFCGVWLRDTSLPNLIAEEAEVVRKHVALNDLVIFETTLVTKSPSGGFSQAIATVARNIEESNDGEFVAVLDIRRARMQRIRPLGGDEVLARAIPEVREVEHPLEFPPDDFCPPPPEIEPVVPNTPEGRLAHWQRKLLDLTTRNRLLHVSDSAKGVRPLYHDIARLEEKLSSGQKITIAPLPDLGISGRDTVPYEQQKMENLKEQVARMV
jgi:hypothetical protein